MKSRLKHSALPITLLLFCFLFQAKLMAQEIKASAKLGTNIITIGQQVKLELTVQYRVDNGKQILITWPEILDTLRKEVEVVSQTKIDTLVNKADPYLFTQSKTILLTSFDSGYWAIPPFKFLLNSDSNGIYTDPFLLQVNTITVDTTLTIKDIKPPYSEEYSWLDWLKDNMYVVYGSLIFIIAVLIIILVIIKLRKIKPAMVIVETPKIPAHILAFEKLEKLKMEKLWQEGKLKLYHSALTEIIREYIENRFKIQAMEQTTDEILFGFRNIAIDEESKFKLKRVLILADLVKFAKENPLANENEQSMTNAYDFINGTMRDENQELKQNKN